MVFNASQAGMAFFLLMATIFNAWFVIRSYFRAFVEPSKGSNNVTDISNEKRSTTSYQLLTYAVLVMALLDIPWVWLCMIQCWNNTLTNENSLHQDAGNDSFGCIFMGWYSTFSLTSMMGSHCLVAYYLRQHLFSETSISNDDEAQVSEKTNAENKSSFLKTTRGFLSISSLLLVTAILFASMPLVEGDGYFLTNGGFCYADFTNPTQSSVILAFVLFFLLLSTGLWLKIAHFNPLYLAYYALFFGTWIIWIPATIYGISEGEEIASPYMIIGAILGHGNAIVNPLLYGITLFTILPPATTTTTADDEGESGSKVLR
jgi:hypothetical protein